LAFLSEFNVQMLYLPGLKNVVADFLSCHPPPSPEPSVTVAAVAAADPIDFEAMAAEQKRMGRQHLIAGSSHKIAFQHFNRNFWPLCHSEIHKRNFLQLHNISYPGRLTSRHLVSSRFVWRKPSNDITNWVRSCLHCQQGKTPPHPPTAAAHPHPSPAVCSPPHRPGGSFTAH
jgi:hypothetical protein